MVTDNKLYEKLEEVNKLTGLSMGFSMYKYKLTTDKHSEDILMGNLFPKLSKKEMYTVLDICAGILELEQKQKNKEVSM